MYKHAAALASLIAVSSHDTSDLTGCPNWRVGFCSFSVDLTIAEISVTLYYTQQAWATLMASAKYGTHGLHQVLSVPKGMKRTAK